MKMNLLDIIEKDNYSDILDKHWQKIEWEDKFTILYIPRGRSASHFLAQSEKTGYNFTIFMIDLLEMIKNGDLEKDIIEGTFIFKKRGQSFGIRLKNTPKL